MPYVWKKKYTFFIWYAVIAIVFFVSINHVILDEL
jgi:hypothetical protein